MKPVFFYRNVLFGVLFACMAFGAVSCDNETEEILPARFEIKTETDASAPVFIVPDSDFVLEYTGENILSLEHGVLPEGWTVDFDKENSKIIVRTTADAKQNADISIKAIGAGDSQIVKEISFYCLNNFTDTKGTFVLNEGNMTTENGSLTYITSDGYVIDDAYKTVNGTELGNVAQDMSFCNGKIYVIAQNGNENAVGTKFDNDGMLVVMNAKTLKKEMAFTKDELNGIDWPTHVAALDEKHVYIRDNKGIYRFDTATKELVFVEGTEDAPKAQFTVMNGKVYSFLNVSYMCRVLEISPESDIAKEIKLPLSAPYKSMYSIAKADNNSLWLTAYGFGKYYVAKFDISTQELISQEISSEPNIGSAGVSFAVKDNNIYYASGTNIYRLKFNDGSDIPEADAAETEEYLCDINVFDTNAGMLYNGLAIHPVTGHLFVNSIKSFAQFDTNQIWTFDTNASFENPLAKYENYTNFPAGFFFYTEN